MNAKLFAFFVSFAFPLFGDQSAATSLWHEAASLYKNGNYFKAAELYEQTILQNPGLWEPHYNAANAYFKSGNTPQALERYWRAYQINPRSGAVVANLRLAAQKTGDTFAPPGVPEALYRTANLLTQNEWAAIAVVIWLIFSLRIIVFQAWIQGGGFWPLGRKDWIVGFVLAGSLAALCGHVVFGAKNWGVLKGPGLLRSGPSENLPVTTQVPEGRFVKILEIKEGWTLIETRKEKIRGWIRA